MPKTTKTVDFKTDAQLAGERVVKDLIIAVIAGILVNAIIGGRR